GGIAMGEVGGGVVYAGTRLVEPGVIKHLEGNRFSLAELNGARTDRVVAVSSALARAGFKAPVQSRIRQEIWLKLIGNATLNPVSALTRATLTELMSEPETKDLIRRLMIEVEAVGTALGIEPDIGRDPRLETAPPVR